MKAIGRLALAVAVLALAGVPARGQDKDRASGKVEIVRLSDMVGKEVLAKDKKTELGTVKDVVIDVQKGRAVFAAVARKEDASRIIAVPSSKLRGVWDDDGKSIKALTIDDDRFLAEAPGVTKEEWDKTEDRAMLGRLASKESGASLARASQAKKATVVDVAGDRIGEIDGIMVNLENSRLLALVGVGGVLGVGERRHVVPWEILRVREAKKEGPVSFMLNVPKDRLEKGPVLGKDEENRLADSTWVAGVYEHYQYGPVGGERKSYRCVTAEEFIGVEVASTDKADDEFGSIEGLAIVPHSGQIAYVAFDVDGKLYAVPLHAFKVTLDKGEVKKVLISVDKAAFKGLKPFDEERWPHHADPAWKAPVGSGHAPPDGGVSPMVLRSSDVLDAEVKDSRRVTFGEIEDFVVDLDAGRVAYVCVGTGGFLGIGESQFAIPWPAMKWSGEKDKFFTLNADRKTLERSVEFNEKRISDPVYIHAVYAVYGLEYEKKLDPVHERKTQP